MRTKVREVFHKGSAAIVERRDERGNVHRSIFPETEVIEDNGETFVENFEEGQPYGVAWEEHIPCYPDEIAARLRNKGIWTMDDYRKNTPVITAVFNEVASLNLQGFKDSILRQGKKDE